MTFKIEQYGRGVVCPFQRDGKGDFANAGGTALLSSDVGELMGIIGPSGGRPGEVAWNTDLGSRLISLNHRKLHSELVRTNAEIMINEVVRIWEDRLRVGPITVTPDEKRRSLNVKTKFIPINSISGDEFTVTHVVEE